MDMRKNFKKVLFVGAGGGNDIFSTLLAADVLSQEGRVWDYAEIAGVISPFHSYKNVVDYGIKGVVETNTFSERFLLRKRDELKIGFVDSAVSQIVKDIHPSKIGKTLGLSLENGSEGLKESFIELAKIFDLIVLVDIGGDIFYGGKEDDRVLSPMFDSMVLKAFVDSKVKGILFEAGPGTDGEIHQTRLTSALSNYSSFSADLSFSSMCEFDYLFQKYIAKKRRGNTVPNLVDAFSSGKFSIFKDFRVRSHIGKEKYFETFSHAISVDLCKKFYLIDPEKIQNPFAVSCKSPYDWFIKTQVNQSHTNNEANLEYSRQGDEIMQFLTPSPLFADSIRKQIVEIGLSDLKNGITDLVYLFPFDWENSFDSSLHSELKDGLIFVSKKLI
jgi:hypothetical protein